MLRALSQWRTTILVVAGRLAVGLFASRHLVGPSSERGASTGPVAPKAVNEYVG